MQYKNGREAKDGDKVVFLPGYDSPVIGILYNTAVKNDYCTGRIAPISPSDPCPNLAECLHLDDVLNVLSTVEEIPDMSKGSGSRTE